ncbi:uncharacterized protein V1518DRAFT_421063 [Limtongia smithiae]|uniref:uncharacterized protein n=1 Tax=Limtongia smithiae TaxID=1125753 RepID=UPI0034CDA303
MPLTPLVLRAHRPFAQLVFSGHAVVAATAVSCLRQLMLQPRCNASSGTRLRDVCSRRWSSTNSSKKNKPPGPPAKGKIPLSPAKKLSPPSKSPASPDAAYVAALNAPPPPPVPLAARMRMTPSRAEIVERGSDTVSDRVVPLWPLSREALPTLQLHLIRTPRVSAALSFAQLMRLLERSPEPEVLLYQAEPHRLYFIVLYALAFVFAVYGLIFLDWAARESWEIFANNYDDLPPVHNALWLAIRSAVTLALFAVPAVCAVLLVMFPTRLVRRLSYLPAGITLPSQVSPTRAPLVLDEPYVRFVVHPLLPRRASPVITLPVSQLDRGKNMGQTRVWTGDGLYGTASRSQFMVFLFEKGNKIPWIVDRQGWFWGDGRVWDVLFGKQSVEDAEKGLSGDDLIRMEKRRRKFEEEQAKKKKELPPSPESK